jgi:four helix bundle protein
LQDNRTLIGWQKANEFVKESYCISYGFPSQEIYGLTSQLRSAALSIPTNLAEGSAQGTNTDYASFVLNILDSAAKTD